MQPPLQLTLKAVLVLAGIACLYLGWIALRWGIADQHAFEAHRFLANWEQGASFSEEGFANAMASSEAAVSWAPENPHYRDQLARLLTIKYVLSRDPADGNAAKKHLLHSRSVRPTWPYNWALYIEIKHHMGEIDEEFLNALAAAPEIGPWEPSVLFAVSKAGVANYASLPDNLKRVVETTISRGLRSPVANVSKGVRRNIESEARGWTLEFTNALIEVLITDEWTAGSPPVYLGLSMRLWPVMNPPQKQALAVKIAATLAQRPGLIRTVRQSDRLPQICPYMPRTQQFSRYCPWN